jgi:hypothetical protein
VNDLEEFLFGSERGDLSGVRGTLIKLQGGRCFYCVREVRNGGAVDHFVPWSRYPVDLGHNFVLADENCNNAKGSLLAAENHLSQWIQRNREFGSIISKSCEDAGLPSNLPASVEIAIWAYEQTAAAGENVWLRSRETAPLAREWRSVFQ